MTFSPNSSGSLLLAPFSQEAEEAVVGAVLISPESYKTTSAFLKPEDFYLTRHRRMWEAYGRLAARGDLIDLTTVSEELRTTGVLEEIGGYVYLIQLINNTPNSMHAEVYGRLVERTSTRRNLLIAADQIRDSAIDESKELGEVLRLSEKAVLDCSARHIERRGGWTEDLAEDHMKDFERRLGLDDAAQDGLLTGFQDVDSLLSGLEEERLYVLAARPGMGKTAWILCALLNMALRGVPVAIHTMEMSTDQLMYRLVAMLSGVPTNAQKRPKTLTRESRQAIVKAYGTLSELPIYIEDAPSPTPREVLGKSEWLVRQSRVKCIFVDGIYRMSADYNTHGDDTKTYSQVAKGLKDAARTLCVPIVATHQLNRDLESRTDKRPLLNDLRQSGRIEEEADVVMFLYRDCMYNASADPRASELIVAKNRDGDVGRVMQGFEKTVTRFYDADIKRVSVGA
jgi:replicative DNA helicase